MGHAELGMTSSPIAARLSGGGPGRPGFKLGPPVRLYQPSATGDGQLQLFEAEVITPVWDAWSASVYFRFTGRIPGQLASDGAGSIIYVGGEFIRRIRLPAAWRAELPRMAAAGAGALVAGGADAGGVAVPRPQEQLQPAAADEAAAAIAGGNPQQPGAGGAGVAGWLVYGSKEYLVRSPLPLPADGPAPGAAPAARWEMLAGEYQVGLHEGGPRGYPAGFRDFIGITADAGGSIYLLDKGAAEGRLRRVSPDGTITTLVTGLPPRYASPTILPNGYLALGSDTELVLLDLALQPLLPRLPTPATARAGAAAAAAAAAGPPPRSLPADLGALLDAQPDGTADLTIRVGERRFHVHRAILFARCDYFRQRLGDDGFADARAAELELPDADADTFALLLCWLYTGDADIPADHARGLAELADRLLLPELCTAALGVVAASMTAGTVVDCLLWAWGCSESRGGGGGFGELVAALKEWYVLHHEEVAAEAGASRKRLAERAPGLSIEVADAVVAWERDAARKRAKRAWR
ncbi:hypothetical protein HXX76_015993 [Chlamydomonas incerta]|uniref:BTB domain-containing protein n=1 Tax=Chlamydomonas incerta TaxID=51695 RepID=A0A835S8W0_CHLIN|nr:hypothetical protein HXX76_015993 [Chlamydomonas incerta]|eukprot:KAG2422469.1 hypothetical protein HXX76_015993 [Chlamydomonas incerta]